MSDEPAPRPAPPPAIDVGWAELLEHPSVTESCTLGSTVGVLAFHGGLEVGTLEIAREVADTAGASLYTVEQPEELRWHVASSAVDPGRSPMLRSFIDHVEVAIALHGYGRGARPWDVLLGGTNRAVAASLASELDRRPPLVGVDRIDAIPPNLRGLHPANPVNLPRAGGVQVELPVRARFPGAHGPVVDAVVAAITRQGPSGSGVRPDR